jgi:hypothetical protein
MKNPYFVTLTKRRELLTQGGIRRIRKEFTRLRHRKVWPGTNGLYQIEVGTIDDLNFSNIHIHAIVDVPHPPENWITFQGMTGNEKKYHELANAWEQITVNSYIIDIKPCYSPRDALKNYLTVHMAKRVGSMNHVVLINRVLRGTRLVQGFGVYAHMGLNIHETVCEQCGALNSFTNDPDSYGSRTIIESSRAEFIPPNSDS